MSTFEENWNFQINIQEIEQKKTDEFEKSLNYMNDHVFKLLEETFKTQRFDSNYGTGFSYDDELRILIEKNKHLRHEIEKRLKEISKQQSTYENYKKDYKLLSQELKETHEAFLLAKKYYKKHLNMYFTIESKDGDKETVFIQFFTETKKDSENYSVRLSRNTILGNYELLQTTPKMKIAKELKQKNHNVSDIPQLLCCLRQEFLNLKEIKHKEN